MSQQNVEVVRQGFDAFSRGGIEAALEAFDPEVEIEYGGLLLDADASYRGYAGVRRLVELWAESVVLRTEVEEFVDAGDDVVVILHTGMQGKSSGAESDARSGQVLTVHNSKVVRWRIYSSRSEALQAVGLSE
jgi:ketosteroid isomerase-like protein